MFSPSSVFRSLAVFGLILTRTFKPLGWNYDWKCGAVIRAAKQKCGFIWSTIVSFGFWSFPFYQNSHNSAQKFCLAIVENLFYGNMFVFRDDLPLLPDPLLYLWDVGFELACGFSDKVSPPTVGFHYYKKHKELGKNNKLQPCQNAFLSNFADCFHKGEGLVKTFFLYALHKSYFNKTSRGN